MSLIHISGEGNDLMGMAIVYYPACPEARAQTLVAEVEEMCIRDSLGTLRVTVKYRLHSTACVVCVLG